MEKKCNKGYSCGASCINKSYICLKSFPDGVSFSLDDARLLVTSMKLPENKNTINSIEEANEFWGLTGNQFVGNFPKIQEVFGQDTNKVVRAVRRWSGGRYSEIRIADKNPENASEEDKELIKYLREFVDKSPKFEGVVFRGIESRKGKGVPELVQSLQENEGGEFIVEAFSSFTSSKGIAEDFGVPQSGTGKTGLIMKTKIRNSGVALGNFAVLPDEEEVLVPKGVRLRIGKVTRISNDSDPNQIYEVELEEI